MTRDREMTPPPPAAQKTGKAMIIASRNDTCAYCYWWFQEGEPAVRVRKLKPGQYVRYAVIHAGELEHQRCHRNRLAVQRRRRQKSRNLGARQLRALNRWNLPRQLSLDAYRTGLLSAPEKALWYGGRSEREPNDRRRAELAAMYEGLPSWQIMRRLIFTRDRGRCWACDRVFDGTLDPELGHIVDRVVGGLDIPENLAPMCHTCNSLKPLHPTREEAERWRTWVHSHGHALVAEIFGALGDPLNEDREIEALRFGLRELIQARPPLLAHGG